METHFDISTAEAPPPPEATLEGTEPPPLPEGEPQRPPESVPPLSKVKMEVEDEEGRYDEEELDEIELPDMPQKKAKLQDSEVFSAPKVAPVKKPRKKRKPMTPEQLERLAEGRKKAFAVRAQKKKERDEMKALEKKVAQKKKEKLEAEIIDTLDDEDIPQKMKEKRVPLVRQQSVVPSITHEDLMNAVAQGVEIYDTKRKAQKKVKKEQQVIEQREAQVRQKVQRALSVNPWDEFLK